MNYVVLVCGITTLLTFVNLYPKDEVAKTTCSAPAGIKHEHTKDDSYAKITFIGDEHHDASQDYARYLKATYLHAKGQYEKAMQEFQPLLRKKVAPHVYEALIRLLFDRGNFFAIANLAQERSKEFTTTFKENLDIKLIIAQSMMHSGKEDKAEELFLELSEQYPDNEQVAYYTAVSYIKGQDLQQALEFIDEALSRQTLKSKHFLFHFLKSKIFLMTNKYQLALKAIEDSLKLFPKFDRGWLFKAMLLEQQGKAQEAIAGYERFLNLVGRDVNVEKQLIQLLFSQEQFSRASHYLQKIKSDTPEYFFDLALIELKAKNRTKALAFINKAIAKKKDFEKAKFLKIEILVSLKKQDETLAFLQDWLSENPSNITLLHTVLLLRKAHISAPALITMLEKTVEKGKHSIPMLCVLADLCQETKKFAQAITHYKKILTLKPNDGLRSRTLFHIGYLYFVTKQTEQLIPTLQESMRYQPTHPSSYNLLAYHYAQKGTQLPQALKLVNKALQKKPDCYYYLDTKGVVLLKMGKKSEAKQVFEHALQKAPHDKIIKKHLQQTKL